MPLQGRGHHIVNQAVLVGDAGRLEPGEVILLINLLEDVFKAAIVLLQDGIFGAQVQWPALHQGLVEAGVGKAPDGFIGVVHGQGHAVALEVEHFERLHLAAVFGREGDGEFTLALGEEVGGAVLVAEGMAADTDGGRPVGCQAGHVAHHNGLAEHDAFQDVADGAVRRSPHLLEVEFLHPVLVGRDGGALDAHAVLLDSVGRVDGDLVVGFVAVLDTQVVVLNVEVQVRNNELVLDELPDNARHLDAVKLDNGVSYFDFWSLP